MRRIVIALTLVLLSLCVSGAVAPAGHAQMYNPTVVVTPSTVQVGANATVTGTGFTPNSYVFAYWQRPDGTTNGTFVVTDATGAFAFTLGFLAAHGTGTEYVAGYDYATGRWSPFATVVVTGNPGPPPTSKGLSASPNPVMMGGYSTVYGAGFSPNNYVFVQWTRPDGTMGGTYANTDLNGSFAFTLGFLPVHGCGTETLTGFDYGTLTYSPSYNIMVTC